jgi:cytidylate kinase
MDWTQVAEQDAALRASVDNASEALARHRYENTIAVGVGFREYARKCGVDHQSVLRYAKAHEQVVISDHHLSISDALVVGS